MTSLNSMDNNFELIPILVRTCPPFRARLVAEADDWLDEKGEVMVCTVMCVLSHFVTERLRTFDYDDNIVELFDLAEQLLTSGSEAMQEAVATCFLENLLNVTPEILDPDSFVPFLGPQSTEYCRAWDEFTGVRTPGLW